MLHGDGNTPHRDISMLHRGDSTLHWEAAMPHRGISAFDWEVSMLHRGVSMLHRGISTFHRGVSMLHGGVSMLHRGVPERFRDRAITDAKAPDLIAQPPKYHTLSVIARHEAISYSARYEIGFRNALVREIGFRAPAAMYTRAESKPATHRNRISREIAFPNGNLGTRKLRAITGNYN